MTLAVRWGELYAYANGRTTLGMEGVRDPENPCDAFVPGANAGMCETDGHYLCRECRESVERCETHDSIPRWCGCGAT